MPDLTNYPAIDVAIGLMVVFFLLSVVCSAIQEFIATITNMRAKYLKRGLHEILDDATVEKIEARLPGKSRSYIDSRQFSLALFDAVAHEKPKAAGAGEGAAAQGEGGRPADRPGCFLVRVVEDNMDDLESARADVEHWFDATMDRVGGWYRRWVQIVLLVIALVVACATNTDTFHMANQLWSDGALRASLVGKSHQIVQAPPAETVPSVGGSADTPAAPAAPSESCAEEEQAADCVKDKFDNVAQGLDDVDELKLPIGWTDSNTPKDTWEWIGKVLGLLTTAFALSLGAPFWFDLLGKVSRLRAAGAKPSGADTSNNEPKRS